MILSTRVAFIRESFLRESFLREIQFFAKSLKFPTNVSRDTYGMTDYNDLCMCSHYSKPCVCAWLTTHCIYVHTHTQLEAANFRVYQTAPAQSRREITAELVNGAPRYDENTQSVLIRNGNSLTAAFYESGIVLIANVSPWGPAWYMNWNIKVPFTFERRTEGLLGLLDGNRDNDFIRRDGFQLPGNIDQRNLYNHYVNSCKLTAFCSISIFLHVFL